MSSLLQRRLLEGPELLAGGAAAAPIPLSHAGIKHSAESKHPRGARMDTEPHPGFQRIVCFPKKNDVIKSEMQTKPCPFQNMKQMDFFIEFLRLRDRKSVV